MKVWLCCVVMLLGGLFGPAQAARDVSSARLGAASDKRVALVIGNGAYQNTRRLPNPGNDADDVARALQGFGFDVIALKDGTRRQMKEKLADFSRRIDGASAALVFFAGHGAQIRGENYLIPVDASVDTEAAFIDESISLNRVLDELDGARNRINIVILDACRDNPVTGKFRSSRNGLAAPASPPKGTVIVYATDPGNLAADGDGRNSPFTAGLLTAFKGKDLSLDGVLTVASEQVEAATNKRQVPYVNGPKTAQKNFRFAVTLNPGAGEFELKYWASIEDSTDAADFEAYLKKYPQGNFRDLAENRLKRLRVAAVVPPAAPLPPVREEEAPRPMQRPPEASVRPSLPVVENIDGWSTERVQALQKQTAAALGRSVETPARGNEPATVLIPGGCYTMGSPENEERRYLNEGAQRRVCVKAFEMGKYEVTFEEWDAYDQDRGFSRSQYDYGWGRAKRPVINVSWYRIQDYLKWLKKKTGKTYRLPSEAEWEYATRAGTTGPYSFEGSITFEKANYDAKNQYAGSPKGDYRAKTVPVGGLPANQWGLHEVHGNVREWVQDCWHVTYAGNPPTDGRAWGKEDDGDCGTGVIRGGAWSDEPRDLRSASRTVLNWNSWGNNIGFRLARTLP